MKSFIIITSLILAGCATPLKVDQMPARNLTPKQVAALTPEEHARYKDAMEKDKAWARQQEEIYCTSPDKIKVVLDKGYPQTTSTLITGETIYDSWEYQGHAYMFQNGKLIQDSLKY